MQKTRQNRRFFAICALQQLTASLMIEEDSGDCKHRGTFMFKTFGAKCVRAEP